MRIAILGGGFTGLSAAYYLQKKKHEISLFEKEPILGGLAVGIKSENWTWYLERAYHHLFANDTDILNFAKEIEFQDIFFNSPETASLFEVVNRPSSRPRPTSNYRTFPLDTPHDLLRFPLLGLPERIRTGMVLAFLKLSPLLTLYEKQTASEFLKKTMGGRVWDILWQELFRKKFGKYAENILASFFWARITKRTKSLGYVRGGFQELINHAEKINKESGVRIYSNHTVLSIEKKGGEFEVLYQNNETKHLTKTTYDIIVSTLPTPILCKIGTQILPKNYLVNLRKIEYLHAVSVILETDKPLLHKTYWLNMCSKKLPFVGVMQHTNFIDNKYYGGKEIAYVANYVEGNNKLIKMTDNEIIKFYEPYLREISNFKFQISNSFVFKASFAQPVFDKNFLKNKPEFITPTKNFFTANLDMTYPYDRGTNYAVRLGREVAALI